MKKSIFLSMLIILLTYTLFSQPKSIPVNVSGQLNGTAIIQDGTFVTPQQLSISLDSLHKVISAEIAKAIANVPPVVVPPVVTPGTGTSMTPFPSMNTKVYGDPFAGWGVTDVIPAEASTSNPNMRGKVTMRFRNKHTGKISGIMCYVMGTGYDGYGKGNGGTWKITLRTDDGTNHWPTQTILGTVNFPLAQYGKGGLTVFPKINFTSAVGVDSGALYHVVIENIDSDPSNNYSGLNTLTQYPPNPSPQQPACSDLDWFLLFSRTPYTTWVADSWQLTPILGLYYTDGYATGQGYINGYISSPAPVIVSGNTKIAEIFTVTSYNRIATTVNLWLNRISGSDVLIVRLEKADGTLMEQGAIAASAISSTVYSDNYRFGDWAKYTFQNAQTLVVGQTYRISFSTASTTKYNVYTLQDGKGYFGNGMTFTDGNAQMTTDGKTWTDIPKDAEVQIYFDVK